ncbi:hypothetical protein [Reichenbachiella sp.]|uniref:hypothetical protein n=1 Tax=Reichenbachiella sp. TaxID=2184521 RepID=UPI003BAEC3AC
MTQKKDKFKFQLKKVELLESTLVTPTKNLEKEVIFNFDLKLEHKFSTESKIGIIVCTVDTFLESKEDNLGNIKASCIFDLPELEQYFDPETKKGNLPDQLALLLNSVTISTTRGIMFSEYRGTFLHNAILPIVDPSQFKVG